MPVDRIEAYDKIKYILDGYDIKEDDLYRIVDYLVDNFDQKNGGGAG